MKFNPDIHKRKSIRLKDHDYSGEGLYFITISIKDKLCLFGEIRNDVLELFDSGKMIEKYWLELENKFDNVKLHDFVVMPNHFHGVIEIKSNNDCNKCRGIPCVCHDVNVDNNKRVNTRFTPTGGKFKYCKNSISGIIQYFKSITTNNYIQNVYNNNRPSFNKKLWQRNFYEHIIRNEESYLKIIDYINTNPQKWNEDKFYYTEI
ncbi:MAG: transposase [Candidatus Gracilibacteria bacterium]